MLSINGKQRKAHLHRLQPCPSPFHLRLMIESSRRLSHALCPSSHHYPLLLIRTSLPAWMCFFKGNLSHCCLNSFMSCHCSYNRGKLRSVPQDSLVAVTLMMTLCWASIRDSQDLLPWPFFTEQREGKNVHLDLTSQATMAVTMWHSGLWGIHLPSLYCLYC